MNFKYKETNNHSNLSKSFYTTGKQRVREFFTISLVHQKVKKGNKKDKNLQETYGSCK